ncbi:hypothetical protein BJ508DRAFT_411807 [Ascobolus immersus RN42]|uniref:BTB domain-containing protein n=1 Tax=Ascobolus immersus RN42 TaxID=1160509 RepID=A0A3N4INR3_ASCIM|nr:hypothetical protein BJ508DRAFT_411807 [Ascobolus immersus RN42]
MSNLKTVNWKPAKLNRLWKSRIDLVKLVKDRSRSTPTWSPLAFHLLHEGIVTSSYDRLWISVDMVLSLGADTNVDNPLLILQAALFVWSDGKLGKEKVDVEGFVGSLATALGYVPESEVEKYRKDFSSKKEADKAQTEVHRGANFSHRTPLETQVAHTGQQIDLTPILSTSVLGKLFDLCQQREIGASLVDYASEQNAQAQDAALQLPDHLKPDHTIILRGPPASWRPTQTDTVPNQSLARSEAATTNGRTPRGRARGRPLAQAKGKGRKRTASDGHVSEPAAKRTSAFTAVSTKSSKELEVEIGRFYIHGCMLAMATDYYAGLLSGPWSEAKEATSVVTTEFMGTALGLQETLRYMFTGGSCNRAILAPSVDGEGKEGPVQRTPLLLNGDDDIFYAKEGGPTPFVRDFFSSLKTAAQLDNYINQCLEVLQPSDYLSLKWAMFPNHPANQLRLRLGLLQYMVKYVPRLDLYSRLALILDGYPFIDYEWPKKRGHGISIATDPLPDDRTLERGPFVKDVMIWMIDDDSELEDLSSWQRPMLDWPPHLVNLFLDTLRQKIDTPVKHNERVPTYTFLTSVGNVQRSKLLRYEYIEDAQNWPVRILGPVRTVLAESLLSLLAKAGHIHESREGEEWVPPKGKKSGILDGSEFSDDWKKANEVRIALELDETAHKRPILGPKAAIEIIEHLKDPLKSWYRFSSYHTSDDRITVEKIRAEKDFALWHFFGGLRKDNCGERFHDDDLIDLIRRCTTLKGDPVVSGGTGLLERGNVHVVEKLLDLFDCERMYCRTLRHAGNYTIFEEVQLVHLGMRRRPKILLEQVKEARARVENQKKEWDSS